MKNIKKVGVIALLIALTFTLLTACGGKTSDEKVIKVAATETPHAEVLEGAVAAVLEKEGWTLQVEHLDDYVQPNVATTDGDVDANYFQHYDYLNDYNKSNGTNLVAVGEVHYEPFGVYKGTKSSFDELKDGDKVGVPSDPTNELRALRLLEANGVLKLKDDVGSEATKESVAEYIKKIEIQEIDAASIPGTLPDLALGVINFNFAYGAGLTSDDAIAYEDESSDYIADYTNIIVVNEENKDSEKTKALVAAVQTDEVRKFIEETYGGLVKVKF